MSKIVANAASILSAPGDPLLSFIHLPKTGGTSLQFILEKHSDGSRPVFHIGHPNDARAFLALPESERDDIFGIFGHMPFGVHRHVNRPVNYLTFLRDPVERTLSSYCHVLRQSDHPQREEVLRLGVAWTGRVSNLQTTNLANYHFSAGPRADGSYWWNNCPPGPTRREILDQAKANLERCAFVGLTETYDDDLRFLPFLRGTPVQVPATVPREQAGGNRLKQSDLTEEQIDRIHTSNSADLELYAHALTLRQKWGGPLNPDFGAAPEATSNRRDAQTRAPRNAARPINVWHPLRLALQDLMEHRPILSLPAQVRTPGANWDYGVATDLIETSRPSSIRVGLQVQRGKVGLCLVSEDFDGLVLDAGFVSAENGETKIVIELPSESTPLRLVFRNYGDAGTSGEAVLRTLEIRERG